MKYLTIFLVAFAHLLASEVDLSNEHSLAATLAGDPSAIVDGKVSAISGDPCLGSIDLIIQGAEPIKISRYYLPGSKGSWNLAWDFAKATEYKGADYRWILQERGEAPIIYKIEGTEKIDGIEYTRYGSSKLNKGGIGNPMALLEKL